MWETHHRQKSSPNLCNTHETDRHNQLTTLGQFKRGFIQFLRSVGCESVCTYSISSLDLWALISWLQQNRLEQPPAAPMQTY